MWEFVGVWEYVFVGVWNCIKIEMVLSDMRDIVIFGLFFGKNDYWGV